MSYTYFAPHAARDKGKLNGMIETLKSGGELPPVVVCGDIAYTGSHRLAAWLACSMDAEAVEVSNEDYEETMELLCLDPMYDTIHDFNVFCAVLYTVTEDDEVKEALKDQIYEWPKRKIIKTTETKKKK